MQYSVVVRVFVALALLCSPTLCDAVWVLKDGRLHQVEDRAWLTPEEHYNLGVQAWSCDDYANAVYQFRIVICNYPSFVSQHPEVIFYTGVGYYYLGEYDFANDELSGYLRACTSPEFLEETMEVKYAIAESLRGGAKRRIFGSKFFPKWLSGKDLAITIYDEIVSTVPCHDLAAQSLFAKGLILCELKDYACSVEAFHMLVRRFPLHELAPEAYLEAIRVYLQQAFCEYQNSDILALAEIVLRRFQQDFPNEERLAEAECDLAQIREIYAYGLYETGAFYERTCHPQASVLYYCCAIKQFPDTAVAQCARERLADLSCRYPGLNVDPECMVEADDACS